MKYMFPAVFTPEEDGKVNSALYKAVDKWNMDHPDAKVDFYFERVVDPHLVCLMTFKEADHCPRIAVHCYCYCDEENLTDVFNVMYKRHLELEEMVNENN